MPDAAGAGPGGSPIRPAPRPEPQAITAMYESFVASLRRLADVPKGVRYAVGERLQNRQMDVLESLVRARYAKKKTSLLADANTSLELCRLLIRSLCDSKAISTGLYENWILELNEVGKQVGGWLKHVAAKEGPPSVARRAEEGGGDAADA